MDVLIVEVSVAFLTPHPTWIPVDAARVVLFELVVHGFLRRLLLLFAQLIGVRACHSEDGLDCRACSRERLVAPDVSARRGSVVVRCWVVAHVKIRKTDVIHRHDGLLARGLQKQHARLVVPSHAVINVNKITFQVDGGDRNDKTTPMLVSLQTPPGRSLPRFSEHRDTTQGGYNLRKC
jgi:hypothetical protein